MGNIVDFNYHYQPQMITKDACMGEKKRVRQERIGHKGGGGETDEQQSIRPSNYYEALDGNNL